MKLRRDRKPIVEEKALDVDASMQGTLTFRDAVNLRINGNFDGNLKTKGSLLIGEHAKVKADIIGETIVIAGSVNGNITATKELKLLSPARVLGNINTPILGIEEGAILEGQCTMLFGEKEMDTDVAQETMTIEELAKYLELDTAVISEWANNGKLPAVRNGNNWTFNRFKIDEWVATEKIK